MRTPAGKECKHYYEDFNRGRNVQECRLVKENRDSMPWRPVDCSRCPVPDILNANASPSLMLEVTIKTRMLGLGRSVNVRAFCLGEEISLEKAYTGCDDPSRRAGLDLFRKALEQDDDES